MSCPVPKDAQMNVSLFKFMTAHQITVLNLKVVDSIHSSHKDSRYLHFLACRILGLAFDTNLP